MSGLDPFDLPEWLGTSEVTWYADSAERGGHLVRGRLSDGAAEVACDLLAVDQAWPAPVIDEKSRQAAHQAWQIGELFLFELDGRLTLAAPGTGFTADRVLDLLARLARAVGAEPRRFVAALRVGAVGEDD